MTSPLAHSTSDSARLMVAAPGFAVGWTLPVYLPAPAPGAPWSRKVDGRYFERLLAVTFNLVTSVVVANRVTTVQLLDGNGLVVTEVPAGGAQVASTTLAVRLVTGAPAYASAVAGGSYGFLPDLLVPPDWTWRAVTAGLDAGDQFSAPLLLMQQFPNDAAMVTAGG
jgi:hypothetical protein